VLETIYFQRFTKQRKVRVKQETLFYFILFDSRFQNSSTETHTHKKRKLKNDLKVVIVSGSIQISVGDDGTVAVVSVDTTKPVTEE
jgi:hypothetical protein